MLFEQLYKTYVEKMFYDVDFAGLTCYLEQDVDSCFVTRRNLLT